MHNCRKQSHGRIRKKFVISVILFINLTFWPKKVKQIVEKVQEFNKEVEIFGNYTGRLGYFFKVDLNRFYWLHRFHFFNDVKDENKLSFYFINGA